MNSDLSLVIGIWSRLRITATLGGSCPVTQYLVFPFYNGGGGRERCSQQGEKNLETSEIDSGKEVRGQRQKGRPIEPGRSPCSPRNRSLSNLIKKLTGFKKINCVVAGNHSQVFLPSGLKPERCPLAVSAGAGRL